MKGLNLLIVGYGNIGHHMYDDLKPLEKKGFTINIYDKYKPLESTKRDIEYDIAFICVPTDNDEYGRVIPDIVTEAIKETNTKLIVIKSTVPIGYCRKAVQDFGKHIVFSPEYYGTTVHAPAHPNFLVLSGERDDMDLISTMYAQIKDGSFRIKYTTYETAEIAKYMENCFLGLKVTFCNEFATIAETFGVSYPELREIFILDERMGDSHTYVDKNQPYYDSHCLNKDIPALVHQVNAPLMEACMKINLERKHKHKNK